MDEVRVKTIRLRGHQLDQARQIKSLANGLEAAYARLQVDMVRNYEAPAAVAIERTEAIWASLATSTGLEDTRPWKVVTQFLDDHDVAFLVFDENADEQIAVVEKRLGKHEEH